MNQQIKDYYEAYYQTEVKLEESGAYYYVQPDPINYNQVIAVALSMSYVRRLDSLLKAGSPKRSESDHLVSLPDEEIVYPFAAPGSPHTEKTMLKLLKLKAFL